MSIGNTRLTHRASPATPVSELSDGDLVDLTRGGDASAFAELWRRHSQAAITVARSYTSLDADDVVAEAFANIYRAIINGGGPTVGFRPYLFTTVRNVAAQWGRAANTLNVEDIETLGDISHESDTLERLEKTLTSQAFRSLPQTWQEVLWYAEVEDLSPRQIGPLMGLAPNAVSALTKRAREGLRVAWVKAHLSSTSTDPECRWTIAKIPAWSRRSVSPRIRGRVDAHLDWCVQCQLVAEEASNVSDRLKVILLPLSAGVAGAAALAEAARRGTSHQSYAMASVAGGSASAPVVTIFGGLVAAAIITATCLTFSGSSGTAVAGAEDPRLTRPVPTEIMLSHPDPSSSAPAVSAPISPTQPTAEAPAPAVVRPVEAAAAPVEAPTAPIAAAQPTAGDTEATLSVGAPGIESSGRPTTVFPAVRGEAIDGAVVTVSVPGLSDEWTSIADSRGLWEIELTDLPPGTWTVTAAQEVIDASGTHRSAESPSVSVALVEPPGIIYSLTGQPLPDLTVTGVPNTLIGYTFVLDSGDESGGALTLDARGNGWLPHPREGNLASVSTFYMYDGFSGPTSSLTFRGDS